MGITNSVPIQMESRGKRFLPLLAVYFASEYYRLPWKPPVTAALIAANTLIYLDPAFLHHILPSIYQVAFNPYLILKNMDLRRFFLSPFYHLGESHLFFNMMSLLWKGIQLEASMGSIEFGSMVATLLTMSQGITLLLAKTLVFFDYPKPFYTQYSVGFSGVLFAMKLILNSDSPDYTHVHGLTVPTRYAAWAELLLIQLVAPDSSFLGHLSGILPGILYLKLQVRNTGLDPFARMVRGFIHIVKWPLRLARGLFHRSNSRGRITGRGSTVGGGDRSRDGLRGVWRCVACTYDNSGWLSECEMCGTRRGGVSGSGDGGEVGAEEIWRRRIERFGY